MNCKNKTNPYENWIIEKISKAIRELLILCNDDQKLLSDMENKRIFENLLNVYFSLNGILNYYLDNEYCYKVIIKYGCDAFDIIDDYFYNSKGGNLYLKFKNLKDTLEIYNQLVHLISLKDENNIDKINELAIWLSQYDESFNEMCNDIDDVVYGFNIINDFFDKYSSIEKKKDYTRKEKDIMKVLKFLEEIESN